MFFSSPRLPHPVNDPVREYRPGSAERAAVKAELARASASPMDVALRIGAEHVRTGRVETMVSPHDRRRVLGTVQQAGPKEIHAALDAAEAARAPWQSLSFEQRASIFLRAAHLAKTSWRDRLNAAAMLNISKTIVQAEIDAACELVDFLTFNVHFAGQLYAEQPISSEGMWNRVELRPLDGFVFAVTPFNFAAIACNLACAPALMGNTVVWKPAPNALMPAAVIMELLEAAGLPPGVINFVPGPATEIGDVVLGDRRLAGLHFTGSTATFELLQRRIADNLERYAQYPRIVGETGGKDFVLVHPSANVQAATVALVRGAFEYQGQKCSAASRAYVPRSLWARVREGLAAAISEIRVGDPADFRNFMGAVIDDRAFGRHRDAISRARADVGRGVSEVLGGETDDSVGWFVGPTLVVVDDPRYWSMSTELFGPILSVYVYDDARFDDCVELVRTTSDYGLTGAIFAEDRAVIDDLFVRLRFAAGNFYVNDKPTGAVVGQQPFGGSRKSGTNDKAGAPMNLLRWTSPRTIKETFSPPLDFRYPAMGAE